MDLDTPDLRPFNAGYVVAQGLGLVMMAMCVGWVIGYRNGFAWNSNTSLQFNWHPVLMLASLVFLSANGILVYRGFRTGRKYSLKLVHAGVQIVSFILMVVGLVAVFQSHNLKTDADGNPTPTPNMYSMHSWIGLVVCILFSAQWVFGLVSFLWPGLRQSLREWYLPLHRWWGVAVFCGACGAALVGLSEKAFFAIPNYSELPGEALLMNCLAVVLVVYCGLVAFLVTTSEYRRRAIE